MKKAWKITIGVLSFFVVFYIFVWIFPNADYKKIGRIIGRLIPIGIGLLFWNEIFGKKKMMRKKNE